MLEGTLIDENIFQFCPERPKQDQNPNFTALNETTSISAPLPVVWGYPRDFFLLKSV